MHCFACDQLLPTAIIDEPTGRYYCPECLEATIEEQLRILEGKGIHQENDMFTDWTDDVTQVPEFDENGIPFMDDIYEDELYANEIQLEHLRHYEE